MLCWSRSARGVRCLGLLRFALGAQLALQRAEGCGISVRPHRYGRTQWRSRDGPCDVPDQTVRLIEPASDSRCRPPRPTLLRKPGRRPADRACRSTARSSLPSLPLRRRRRGTAWWEDSGLSRKSPWGSGGARRQSRIRRVEAVAETPAISPLISRSMSSSTTMRSDDRHEPADVVGGGARAQIRSRLHFGGVDIDHVRDAVDDDAEVTASGRPRAPKRR